MTTLYQIERPTDVAINPSGISRASCEMRWATHSLLGVDRRRGPTTDGRDRGKAMHVFVDAYVRHYAHTGELLTFDGREGEHAAGEIFDNLYAAEDIDFEEDTCHEILDAARAQLPKLGLERFDVVHHDGHPMVELDLHAVVDGIHYQAIVDAVLRHKMTREIWLVDWKTTPAQIDITKTANCTEHDMQLALQRFVLAANGVHVDRSALVQIRSVAPQPPGLTEKTKKVVRALDKISCDVDTYRAALIANNENPDDPKNVDKLRQLGNCVYVRWLPDVTSTVAQAALVKELRGQGERLYQIARGEREPIRNIHNVSGHAPYNSGCRRCDYDKWCRAAIRNGGQPDFSLVGVDYERNDKAQFAKVESTTPIGAHEAYVAYTKAYGTPRAEHEVFEP